MTRRGRIPDHIAQQLDTNRNYTHGTCDECGRETRTKVEHPDDPSKFVCEACEADVFMRQEDIDLNEFE